MKTDYEYIRFERRAHVGITDRFACIDRRSGAIGEELGIVKWHGPWRQYCYFPTSQAVCSAGCLRDIASFIVELRAEEGKAG